MLIVLLIVAIVCWLIAGIPGFVTVTVDKVSWGWLGLFFFGLWVLLSGFNPLSLFRKQS